jgi:hypothetical protein
MKNNTDHLSNTQKNQSTGEDEDNEKKAHVEKNNPQDNVSSEEGSVKESTKNDSKEE